MSVTLQHWQEAITERKKNDRCHDLNLSFMQDFVEISYNNSFSEIKVKPTKIKAKLTERCISCSFAGLSS